MRSKLAEQLREEQRQDVMKMTPEERLELALRLGEDDLQFFMSSNGLEREEAIRVLERFQQAGRKRSRCLEELIG